MFAKKAKNEKTPNVRFYSSENLKNLLKMSRTVCRHPTGQHPAGGRRDTIMPL